MPHPMSVLGKCTRLCMGWHGDWVTDPRIIDAIVNRKADATLYLHESLGGMTRPTSKHLNFLAREAKKNGCDGTDYTRSYTANSFVTFYAQRLSWASAGGVADGVLASLAKASRGRLRDRPSGSP